jgi:hypothetical protein
VEHLELAYHRRDRPWQLFVVGEAQLFMRDFRKFDFIRDFTICHVQSLVQIGTVPTAGELAAIESPKELGEKIGRGVYTTEGQSAQKILTEEAAPTLIGLTISVKDVQGGIASLKAVDERIVAEHQKRFADQIAALNQNVAQAESRVRGFALGDQSTAALLLAVFQEKLLIAGASPTKVLKEPHAIPVAGFSAVAQKMLFVIFVAACAALFAALFRAWWIESKREMK